MPLRVQYPIVWRRGRDFDIRSKWFTPIYDEIRTRIPTRLIRFPYVRSRIAYPLSRWQVALLERSNAVTHINTNLHSFLLRPHSKCPTVISCYDIGQRWTTERLPLADRVIASARKVKEELETVVRLPREPEVIHLAVPANYQPANLPRQGNRILFVGTEQPRKNVAGLFRIFARVANGTDAVLVKVGAPSRERARFQALARDLGIQDRVTWRDLVGEDELLHLYHTSAVAVVPSFIEGFSMPCLEAMATGCPLIASSRSAIPEVVGDGGLLIDPEDESAWADAILRVRGDPVFAADLSRRGLRRSQAFSAKRSAEQVLRIYEDVWAERGGG